MGYAVAEISVAFDHMRESALNSSSSLFPMAYCGACGKLVLTALAFDDNDKAPRRCCAHCDQPIRSAIEWVKAEELDHLGYGFGSPARSGKGCGGGCGGSCSSRRN